MLARLTMTSPATRAIALLALLTMLGGCGTSSPSGNQAEGGSVVVGASTEHATCPATVLAALKRVAERIYHQGVSSERTGAASHLINASNSLREAVQRGDVAATRAVTRELVAAGRMTNLRVLRGGQVLADVGGPAVAPLRGTLKDASGHLLGSYVSSVWADEGLIDETNGVTGGRLALRVGARSVGGSLALAPGPLPGQGTLTLGGRRYQYTSFHGEAYPSGAMRVYLLRSISSIAGLCGATAADTVVHTLGRIASLIYAGEAGRRTLPQIQRVQRDQPLLRAVASRDPLATRTAIERLLTEHIVRLRVNVGGRPLADVGGPDVLAPVTAPLRLAGRTIGSLVLSIQDDEGYLRLTKRLVGLRVLMYVNPAHPQLVKNSLGPSPGTVPASGSYEYRGRRFRVFTLNAQAFPTGPLTIRVLIPIPYS
jgi:hypothetical protein